MGILNFIGDWIENTSEVPNQLRNLADDLDDAIIEQSQNIKQELSSSGSQVKQNLTKSKFASLGAKAGMWLAKPMNQIIAVGVVIGLVWGILSVSKKT